jgi:hypothetical protein
VASSHITSVLSKGVGISFYQQAGDQFYSSRHHLRSSNSILFWNFVHGDSLIPSPLPSFFLPGLLTDYTEIRVLITCFCFIHWLEQLTELRDVKDTYEEIYRVRSGRRGADVLLSFLAPHPAGTSMCSDTWKLSKLCILYCLWRLHFIGMIEARMTVLKWNWTNGVL